jgi:hypothetical protein
MVSLVHWCRAGSISRGGSVRFSLDFEQLLQCPKKVLGREAAKKNFGLSRGVWGHALPENFEKIKVSHWLKMHFPAFKIVK